MVCCGSGGVGKTTVSATFALAAARAGRRACVVTVDPARRLADALGVQSLPNTPTEVAGEWPGHLFALMLDSKGTFDDLVKRYARTPEQAESILANRLYQNLAGALSGTQEYMAMEKLYELVNSERVRHRRRRHATDPQRIGPARCAQATDAILGEPPLPRHPRADPHVAARRGRGHPGVVAHDREGGRGRDRAGRRGLLPGLRGDGGRLPHPRHCGARAAGRPRHGLRAGDVGAARRRDGGRLLRRPSWPSGRWPWPRSW